MPKHPLAGEKERVTLWSKRVLLGNRKNILLANTSTGLNFRCIFLTGRSNWINMPESLCLVIVGGWLVCERTLKDIVKEPTSLCLGHAGVFKILRL